MLPAAGAILVETVFHKGRQPGKDLAQIGEGVEVAPPARFDDSVEDGASPARFGFADEEPVLFAHGGGPDSVFDQVVVDLQAANLIVNRTVRWDAWR